MKLPLRKFRYFCPAATLLFFLTGAYSQEADSTRAPADSAAINEGTVEGPLARNPPVWTSGTAETRGWIAEDVVDFTQLLPAFFPVDYGSLGQTSPLSYRGSTPQMTDIWFDELHLENPVNGFASTTLIPINFVKEFASLGADSFAPFGGQSAGGVFRVESHEFDAQRPYSRVNFRAGDWGYSDLGIFFNLPLTKSLKFTIGGNRQGVSGFEANRNHTGSRILGRLSYRPRRNFELNYLAFLNKNEVEIPAPLLPDFVPRLTDAARKDKRFDQVLSLKLGDLAKVKKLFKASLFFSRLQNQSLNDTLAFDNQVNMLGARTEQEIKAGAHLIAFGGEVKLHDLSSARLGNRADRSARLFVRDEFYFTENWRFGLQAHLEKRNRYSAAFSPAAYLYYEPVRNKKVWLGLKRARRYPSFAERYWPTSFFRGNPNLGVETGTGFELGAASNNGDVKLQTTFFVHRTDDWIGNRVRTNSLEFGPANLGKRSILGHELKVIWNFSSGGEFGFISSYLALAEGDPAKQLQAPGIYIYSYVDLGRALFDEYVYATLRLTGRVIGERTGLTYGNDTSLPDVEKLPETVLFDGQLSFQFSDARLSISMENLFDRHYQLVPGFNMPPKTLRFEIVWEFWD